MGLFIAGVLTIYGMMILSMTLTLLSLSSSIYNPMTQMSSETVSILSTKSVLNKLSEIKECDDNGITLCSAPKIELKDLSIRYSDRVKLENISYTFNSCEKYCIIGQSGVGKTTLLDCISGKKMDKDREILFNLIGIDKVSRSSINSLLSVCKRENNLFYGSLKDNITMFEDESCIDKDRLLKLIDECHLNDFLAKRGLDTLLDDNDSKISTGERERISLARSLYLDKPVLILDEMTSALDKETKSYIYDSLSKIKNKAVTMVSHDQDITKEKWIDHILKIEDKNLLEM